jgi:hypothetical protein
VNFEIQGLVNGKDPTLQTAEFFHQSCILRQQVGVGKVRCQLVQTSSFPWHANAAFHHWNVCNQYMSFCAQAWKLLRPIDFHKNIQMSNRKRRWRRWPRAFVFLPGKPSPSTLSKELLEFDHAFGLIIMYTIAYTWFCHPKLKKLFLESQVTWVFWFEYKY